MLSREEVLKIAKMARLTLSDEQVAKYQKELSDFLDLAEQLKNVDTEGVEPLYQVTGLEHVVREDKAKPCNDEVMEKLVAASPQGKEDNQYLVKNVL
jgi:aspartyl-tRNA(Asn)/glutamyl-tRNA(Gln) amidotransferase subunit C